MPLAVRVGGGCGARVCDLAVGHFGERLPRGHQRCGRDQCQPQYSAGDPAAGRHETLISVRIEPAEQQPDRQGQSEEGPDIGSLGDREAEQASRHGVAEPTVAVSLAVPRHHANRQQAEGQCQGAVEQTVECE